MNTKCAFFTGKIIGLHEMCCDNLTPQYWTSYLKKAIPSDCRSPEIPPKNSHREDVRPSRVAKWAALRNEAVEPKHLLTSGWNITVNELKKLRREACANRPSGNSTQPLETAKYSPCNELQETDVKEGKSCEGKTIKGCSPVEPWGQTDTEKPKWKGRWGGGGDDSHLKIWSDACRSGTCQQPCYLYLTSLCLVFCVDMNALRYLDRILQNSILAIKITQPLLQRLKQSTNTRSRVKY